ncbi:MAG: polyprenyl synthetase family protein [Mucinivorans sp.]
MSKFIDQLSQLIEVEIGQLPLPTDPEGLYTPIRYIMEDGGKRMRPMLCVLACEMFCGRPMRAKAPAMAIEVFHNFTLLHDDIMDRANMRRSRATVHTLWGDNTAILSGDAMMIFAYTLLSDSDLFGDVFAVFSRSSIEVCEGQQLDMDFEKRDVVTRDQYLEMIRLKTASLMASALVMGAIEGGASPLEQMALHRFGELLGLAFQIQDDRMDTYGDEATFGKKIGGDIAEGKKTFLKIIASELSDNQSDSTILRESRDFDQVKAIYDKYDVDRAAQQAIEQYYEQAIECLAILDPQPTEHLREYAQMILKRNK